MDEVEIDSVVGLGTKIKIKKMIKKVSIDDEEVQNLMSLGADR